MTVRTVVALAAVTVVLPLSGPLSATGRAPIKLPDIENPKIWTTGQIGRSGGTLVAGEISDPRTFNLIVSQETSSTVPLSRVFDGLVETNADTLEVGPGLAESWTTSLD